MKMTKKLLIGAVLVAAVLSISCQKEIGGINWKKGVIGSGDGTTTFTVKQTNESKTNTIRGLKQVGILDRAQGTCIVKQFDQTSSSCDGMVGFATYFVENKTDRTAENYGTYNFLVVGVRNAGGVTQTYASYFCNIRKDELDHYNFGASYVDSDGKTKDRTKNTFAPTATEPYEIVIEKFPKVLTNVTFDKDKTLTVGIKFEQEDETGDIRISWFKDLETNTQAATTSGGTLLYKTKALGSNIGRDKESPKGKICAYANIQPEATLNARWDFYDISMKPIDSANYVIDDDFIDVGDIIFE